MELSKSGLDKRDKDQQTLERFFLKEKIKDITSTILSKLPMGGKK